MTSETDRRTAPDTIWTAGIGVAAAAFFFILSLSRWNAGRVTNYDLGIFSQSARSWSIGHLPYSDLRQLHLLGDHFSPMLAVLGPLWRIWPDPRGLLLFQGICLGAAVAMAYHFARVNLGARWALLLAMVGVLSRGVLSGALFDVHEVTIAAPAVVLLCIAVRDARFRTAVAASLVLGLTKEDMGLTVAMAGACWWAMHRGRDPRYRTHAVALGALGAVSLAVAKMVISAVNGGSEYTHYFSTGAYSPIDLLARLAPVGLFAITALFIGLRSPVALIALPTLGWRVLANNPNYWDTGYHYDVVPWAVAVVAATDGLTHRRHALTPRARKAIIACSVVTAALGVITIGDRWGGPGALVHSSTHVRNLEQAASRIPDGSRVAAINSLGPYVVARTRTFNLRTGLSQPVDYAFFASAGPWASDFPPCARQALAARAKTGNWATWTVGRYVVIHLRNSMAITDAYRSCQ